MPRAKKNVKDGILHDGIADFFPSLVERKMPRRSRGVEEEEDDGESKSSPWVILHSDKEFGINLKKRVAVVPRADAWVGISETEQAVRYQQLAFARFGLSDEYNLADDESFINWLIEDMRVTRSLTKSRGISTLRRHDAMLNGLTPQSINAMSRTQRAILATLTWGLRLQATFEKAKVPSAVVNAEKLLGIDGSETESPLWNTDEINTLRETINTLLNWVEQPTSSYGLAYNAPYMTPQLAKEVRHHNAYLSKFFLDVFRNKALDSLAASKTPERAEAISEATKRAKETMPGATPIPGALDDMSAERISAMEAIKRSFDPGGGEWNGTGTSTGARVRINDPFNELRITDINEAKDYLNQYGLHPIPASITPDLYHGAYFCEHVTPARMTKLVRFPKGATAKGIVPELWHRFCEDGSIFRHRRKGGAILIDCSGSMQWDWDFLHKMISFMPAATVAAYSGIRVKAKGDDYFGRVCIIAKNGRWAVYNDKTIPAHRENPPSAGNTVDTEALMWLAGQKGPRVWVSDGQVCGGMLTDSKRMNLQTAANAAMKTYKIIRTPTLEDAAYHLKTGRMPARASITTGYN